MDEKGPRTGRLVLKKISKALLLFIGIAVVLPLVIGYLAGVGSAQILAMVTSTLLLQAAAPPVGMAMGLSPAIILVTMGCFAVGMVMAIFEICDGLSASSQKVRNWIDKVAKISDKHPVIKKYGAISCCFIAWIPGIGLYGTPVIAWVFKWKRLPAIIFTVTGFLIAAFFVLFFASKINEVLLFASYTGIIIFAITGMLALGFSIPGKVIPGPLTDKKLVLLLLVANFILVPLVAYLLTISLGLPQDISVGLMLVAAAAGVPFLPRIVQVGGDNYSNAGVIALFVTILSVVYIPFILYALVPAETFNLPIILLALIGLLVVPLAAGLMIRSKKEQAAVKFGPWLSKISYAAIIVSFGAVFWVYFDELQQIIGTTGFFAAVILILVAFGIGWLFGAGPGMKKVLAFGTAQRNLAIAGVIAVLGFTDHSVLVMVMVTGVIGMVMLILLGKQIRKSEAVKPPELAS
jgi:BASS family bile acid:Na+ symporter